MTTFFCNACEAGKKDPCLLSVKELTPSPDACPFDPDGEGTIPEWSVIVR